MFNLTPEETFKASVKVNVATKSGAWREESFTGEFKRTPEEDREELLALKNVELVRRVLIGWDMKDAQGQPVPFDDNTLTAFCRLTGAVRETTMTYWKHNVGAKEKN